MSAIIDDITNKKLAALAKEETDIDKARDEEPQPKAKKTKTLKKLKDLDGEITDEEIENSVRRSKKFTPRENSKEIEILKSYIN